MSTNLYHGDCLEVLQGIGPVDTVITDPIWPNAPDGMFSCADPKQLLHDALEAITAKRIVIVMRCDSDPRFLEAVPVRWPFFRVQILRYAIPMYIGRVLGGEEIAYCFGEPLPSAPGRRVIPTYTPKAQPSERVRNGHPCSKNLCHFTWLVNWWTLPGETVLDPFMGSGTTGEACIRMGRNFVGIEIEEKWFEIARLRLENSQPNLIAT